MVKQKKPKNKTPCPPYIFQIKSKFLNQKKKPKQTSLIGVFLLRSSGVNSENVGQNLITENPQGQPKGVELCHAEPV